MAKGRLIHKKITRSKQVCGLPNDSTRLLFVYLLSHTDDFGRAEGDATLVKSLCFPLDKSKTDKQIETMLQALHDARLIYRWKNKRDGYFYVKYPGFGDHQSLRKDRISKSHLPDPPRGEWEKWLSDNGSEITINRKEKNGVTTKRQPSDNQATTKCQPEGKGREVKLSEANNNNNPVAECRQGANFEQSVVVDFSKTCLSMTNHREECQDDSMSVHERLLSQLVAEGLWSGHAQEFVNKYSPQQIVDRLIWFRQQRDKGKIKNPAAYLYQMLKDGWLPADEFVDSVEKELCEKRLSEQRERKKQQQREQEWLDWKEKTDEEKIKGHLLLWKSKFKQKRGRSPDETEIQQKRQELLASLPDLEDQLFGDLKKPP